MAQRLKCTRALGVIGISVNWFQQAPQGFPLTTVLKMKRRADHLTGPFDFCSELWLFVSAQEFMQCKTHAIR